MLSWVARWTGYHTPEKRDRNATSALVDRDFASIISKKPKTLQDGCQSCAQQNPHDTRNGEDTKGTCCLFGFLSFAHLHFLGSSE